MRHPVGLFANLKNMPESDLFRFSASWKHFYKNISVNIVGRDYGKL
jgi:hypothetical protein